MSDKFDEAAFDEATSKPNGWNEVPDPVAEVRQMRGDTPQGDAAKMRAALECIRNAATCGGSDFGNPAIRGLLDQMEMICATAKAALAAPPRNCDVGTAEEQARRYAQHCDTYLCDDGSKPCTGCSCCGRVLFGKCELARAQMPYEAKED